MNTLTNKESKLFLTIGGFFIANALIAEFIGVKIFSLEATLGIEPLQHNLFGEQVSFNLTAGVVLWPIVFVMTDIINEYFGKRGVKFLSYLTAVLIIFAFVMVYISIHLAPADWWIISGISAGVPNFQLAFASIFGQGLWIILGSLVAFLVGQILDVAVFQKLKSITGESKLWLRATGSTLVSQFVDSFVVLIIAFRLGADWSWALILAVGLNNYLYKFVVALILTPLIYLAHLAIDNYLGKELSDKMKAEASQS
ncbi:queuosine precursor transporter [Bacteroidia bacterium]|nr:queuosine precursor transporter [Bacteroidia bacterium]